jgi:two-component system, sensor histidine kinase
MMGLTINGVRCHGVMLKQRDHYIYAYVPDSIIFQTLLQNVIMCLFIYLIVVVLIWMIYRKSQKNILKIEKEKEQKYQKSLLEAAKKAIFLLTCRVPSMARSRLLDSDDSL